jgi:hypothetical protein
MSGPEAPHAASFTAPVGDPLDALLDRYDERSIAWITRRALEQGLDALERSDAWIERELLEIPEAIQNAPSQEDVLRPWMQGRATARALAAHVADLQRQERAEYWHTRGQNQTAPTTDPAVRVDGAGRIHIPRRWHDLLGDVVAGGLLREANEELRRMKPAGGEYVRDVRAERDAQLPSLDNTKLELEALRVALLREWAARRRLAQTVEPGAGDVGNWRQRRARGTRLRGRPVPARTEEVVRALGREPAALAFRLAGAKAQEWRGLADLTPLVAYRDELQARIRAANRRGLLAARRHERDFRIADRWHRWHRWHMGGALMAAAEASFSDRGQPAPKRLRWLEQVAEFHRDAMEKFSPALDRAAARLREARRLHAHPDNLTNTYADLLAAEAVLRERAQELADTEVETGAARRSPAHRGPDKQPEPQGPEWEM